MGTTRGIVHSVSYKNANYVLENSRHKGRMKIPTSDEMRKIKEVLSTADDMILVSPAMIEGVDLEGDLSRFQIFIKIPYLFLGDIWIRKRMEYSRKWYEKETINHLVQGSGRSVRSEDDYAMTFILDGNFRRLYKTNKELFPVWYQSAVQFLENQ